MKNISYAECNFYFGYIDNLIGHDHKVATIKEVTFIIKKFDFLFKENENITLVMDSINFDNTKDMTFYKNKCIISIKFLLNNIETLIENIYDLNSGFNITSSNLFIDISFDPVDIKIKYLDNET